MWERSKIFIRRAGTVILGISIVLWFLATYPRFEIGALEKELGEVANSIAPESTSIDEAITKIRGLAADQRENETNRFAAELQRIETIQKEIAGERLRHSFAGRMGHLIEPIIAPLGFDWKIGIGIVASFAAREVFVSTMSTVYNVGEVDDSETGMNTVAETLKSQVRRDGTPVYTARTGITLMVFYVFAMQCVSTVAVVRRETNSWKWPLFQWFYMGVLAWGFAFITYQGGRLLGWE